jgi:putative transcriptional regulator
MAAQRAGDAHVPLFRSGKVRGVRFSTLAKLCAALECQPGDLLAYEPGPDDLLDDVDD